MKAEGAKNLLWCQWQFLDPHPQRVLHSIGDSCGDGKGASLTNSLGAKRAALVGHLNDYWLYVLGKIEDRSDLIIEKRSVHNLPLFETEELKQRQPEMGDRSAHELLLAMLGIDRSARIAHAAEAENS